MKIFNQKILHYLETINRNLIIATLFLVPLSFIYYRGYFVYEPIKLPLFFILVDLLILINLLIFFCKRELIISFDLSYILTSLFFLFVSIKSLFSDSPFLSERAELFLRLFIFFSLSIQTVRRYRLKIIKMLFIQVLIISLYGIVQAFNIFSPGMDIYGSRMYNSFFSHSNSSGHYVAILFPIIIGFIASARKLSPEKINTGSKLFCFQDYFRTQIDFFLLLGTLPIVVYLSIISCKTVFCGLAIVVLLHLYLHLKNKIHRILFLIFILFIEILTIFIAPKYFAHDQAILIRMGIWSSMLSPVRDNLLWGVGSLPFTLTPYYDDFLKWLTGYYNLHIYEAHNDFLEMLYENGIFTLLSFVTLFLLPLIKGIKDKNNCNLLYSFLIFLVSAFFNFPMREISTLILFVVLLSLLEFKKIIINLNRIKIIKILAICLLISMPFLFKFDIDAIKSPLLFIKAGSDSSDKLKSLKGAIIGNVNNIKMFHEFLLYTIDKTDNERGIKLYEDFIKRAPNIPTSYSNLGLIFALDNKCEEASTLFKRAFSLNPYHPLIYRQYIVWVNNCCYPKNERVRKVKFYERYINSLKEQVYTCGHKSCIYRRTE